MEQAPFMMGYASVGARPLTTASGPAIIKGQVIQAVEGIITLAGAFPSRDLSIARTKAEEMLFWYLRSLEGS